MPSCGDATALSPDKNATFELIQKLMTDIAEATSDHVLHLGGDEVHCMGHTPPPYNPYITLTPHHLGGDEVHCSS